MGEITLHPSHIVVRWYSEEETIWPASESELSEYFFCSLSIDPQVTLGDLFRLLERGDPEFLETVLGEHIEPLLEEARLPPEGDDGDRIEFLRVYNTHEDDRLLREFDGWGAWSEDYEGAWKEHPDWPREGAISVSLTPVNQLLDIPLRYDPSLVFRSAAGSDEYRTRIDITFIEFLKVIFYDLTFYGRPENRDEMRAELTRRVEEIDSGKAKLIPADEVLKELRERFGGDGES